MKPLRARLDGLDIQGVAVDNRGLAYGDGLFETIAVHLGRPRLLGLHLERLADGCRRLLMSAPPDDWLRTEIDTLAGTPGCGVIKLIVFREAHGRGYRPGPAARGCCLALAFAAGGGAAPRDGLRLRLCTLRLSTQPALAGIKHLNRLEQVLARAEWNDPEIDEGLMLDSSGGLVEATQANLFLVRDGRLCTPDLSGCGVAGVMRRVVIEHLAPALNIPVDIGMLEQSALEQASEVMLSNSLMGLRPVRALEGRRWPVGPVFSALHEQLQREWDNIG